MSRVLVLSDTQAPFNHPKAISFFKAIYKKHNCDKVVHIGDEVDNKFLKYMSVNDPLSAKEQHLKAKKFMKDLYRAFPKAHVCNSNHSERLNNQGELASIPEFMLKTPSEYLDAPTGWKWADQWIIDDVLYEHGHKYGGQKPHEIAVMKNFRSTVIGHFAAVFGVRYFTRNDKMIFGACTGCMTVPLNDAHMGFGMKYSKKYSEKPTLGCLVIIDGKQCITEPFIEKK